MVFVLVLLVLAAQGYATFQVGYALVRGDLSHSDFCFPSLCKVPDGIS